MFWVCFCFVFCLLMIVLRVMFHFFHENFYNLHSPHWGFRFSYMCTPLMNGGIKCQSFVFKLAWHHARMHSILLIFSLLHKTTISHNTFNNYWNWILCNFHRVTCFLYISIYSWIVLLKQSSENYKRFNLSWRKKYLTEKIGTRLILNKKSILV